MKRRQQYVEVLRLKESYPFKCWKCGHEQRANPSIFMTGFQMNMGGGQCLKCGTYLGLRIHSSNKKMISFDRENKRESGKGRMPDKCYKKITLEEFESRKARTK